MSWKLATVNAITSLTLTTGRNTFTRQELIRAGLDVIIETVGSVGRTPESTLSRVLQELRDENYLEFIGSGEYRLISSSFVPPCADIPDDILQSVTRVPTTVSRILRDSKIVAELKRKYAYRCQICDIRLELKSGFYCEGHHVRPLGTPHNGPDIESNIVIVCPNHHVLLDYGAFVLARDAFRSLLHPIGEAFLAYHNEHICGSAV